MEVDEDGDEDDDDSDWALVDLPVLEFLYDYVCVYQLQGNVRNCNLNYLTPSSYSFLIHSWQLSYHHIMIRMSSTRVVSNWPSRRLGKANRKAAS